MDIKAVETNSYHTYQSALKQESDLISSLPRTESRPQDIQANRPQPRFKGEESIVPAPQTQEDEAAPEKDRTTQPDAQSTLTQNEKLLVEKLKKADAEVRAHEMAHIAAGSEYITSGATFSYQKGPDGQNYAVGGEVSIDTSPEPGDPKATLQKMRQVRAAALAPTQPSSQDLKVASNAASQAAKAMAEITQLVAEEQANQKETAVSDYTRQQVSQAYAKTGSMPDEETRNSFHIAV